MSDKKYLPMSVEKILSELLKTNSYNTNSDWSIDIVWEVYRRLKEEGYEEHEILGTGLPLFQLSLYQLMDKTLETFYQFIDPPIGREGIE